MFLNKDKISFTYLKGEIKKIQDLKNEFEEKINSYLNNTRVVYYENEVKEEG